MLRLFVFCLVLSGGCATWRGDHPQLAALEKAFGGAALRAQCTLRRAQLADDPTRDLALPHPVNARVLMVDRGGEPRRLTEGFRRIGPGSLWRVTRISGPGGTEAWLRPLRSPRHLIWIELRRGMEHVLVPVPEVLEDGAAIEAWFADQFAKKAPPAWDLAAGPRREALRAGRVIPGLTPDELQIARCAPDEVIVDVTAQPSVERWIYLDQAGNHEMAVLLGGLTVGRMAALNEDQLKALRAAATSQSKP
jgi:hypothetical protein